MHTIVYSVPDGWMVDYPLLIIAVVVLMFILLSWVGWCGMEEKVPLWAVYYRERESGKD